MNPGSAARARCTVGLGLAAARVITSSSQFTLDTYIVLDTDGDSIGDNPAEAATLTARANLVAVVSNGTAVLGLGPGTGQHTRAQVTLVEPARHGTSGAAFVQVRLALGIND